MIDLLMLIDLLMVFLICWFHPTHLMYTAEAHLEEQRIRNAGQKEVVTPNRITSEPTIEEVNVAEDEGQGVEHSNLS